MLSETFILILVHRRSKKWEKTLIFLSLKCIFNCRNEREYIILVIVKLLLYKTFWNSGTTYLPTSKKRQECCQNNPFLDVIDTREINYSFASKSMQTDPFTFAQIAALLPTGGM